MSVNPRKQRAEGLANERVPDRLTADSGTLTNVGFGYKVGDAREKLKDPSRPPRAHPLVIGLAVFVLVLTVAVVTENFIHDIARSAFEENIRSNLKRLARAGATLVDAESHALFVDRNQERTPAYFRAVEPLARLQNSDTEIAFVYTCVLRDGKVFFVLDPTPEGDRDRDGEDDKSHIMQEYPEASPELLTALQEGTATADIEPYADRWGTFVSGYAPIRDKHGKLVGIVGVDLSAENYENRMAGLRDAYEYGFIVALMLAILSGLAAGTMQYRSFRLHLAAEQRESRYREQITLTLERLESALRIAEVSRNRFSDLFEGIPVSCLTFDADGNVFEWNTLAISKFGLQPHSAMEQSLTSVLGEHLFGEKESALVKKVLAGESFADSIWTDGERHFLVSGHSLYAPDGEISGGILAAVDVTAQKVAEDQVQHQLEALNDAHDELNLANLQLQDVNAMLEEMATTDMLTGLPNRRAFYEALDVATSEAKRGRPLTLVQVDIDHFKRVNDTYGHHAGDIVLCQFAAALRASVRPIDLVARHGGEEFFLILPGAEEAQAMLIVERVRSQVRSIESEFGDITASFGMAYWQPSIESDEKLMQLTDEALYEAKRQGRDRIVVADPSRKAA